MQKKKAFNNLMDIYEAQIADEMSITIIIRIK